MNYPELVVVDDYVPGGVQVIGSWVDSHPSNPATGHSGVTTCVSPGTSDTGCPKRLVGAGRVESVRRPCPGSTGADPVRPVWPCIGPHVPRERRPPQGEAPCSKHAKAVQQHAPDSLKWSVSQNSKHIPSQIETYHSTPLTPSHLQSKAPPLPRRFRFRSVRVEARTSVKGRAQCVKRSNGCVASCFSLSLKGGNGGR